MKVRNPRVLILTKDLRLSGGVADFVSMLIKNCSEDVQVQYLRIGQLFSDKRSIIKLLYPLADNAILLFKVLNGSFDVVHLNSALLPSTCLREGLFMITFALMRFRKTIVFFHGWDPKIEAIIKRRFFLRCIFRWAFGRAATIFVLATSFRDSLADMGFDVSKVKITTTMFDGRLFDGVKRTYIYSMSSRKTILFLSRFIRKKGCYELMEAYEKILKKFPNTRLVMAGDGPEHNRMKMWVKQRKLSAYVSFAGYVRESDKAQLLIDADLFVLPTNHCEGCPISLLEAMAAGLPVITTPVGGIPDIFIDGENGILIDHVSPHKIATAMERLLNDEDLSSKVQENNRREAWEKYEAAIVTKRMEAIYMEVASAQ